MGDFEFAPALQKIVQTFCFCRFGESRTNYRNGSAAIEHNRLPPKRSRSFSGRAGGRADCNFAFALGSLRCSLRCLPLAFRSALRPSLLAPMQKNLSHPENAESVRRNAILYLGVPKVSYGFMKMILWDVLHMRGIVECPLPAVG